MKKVILLIMGFLLIGVVQAQNPDQPASAPKSESRENGTASERTDQPDPPVLSRESRQQQSDRSSGDHSRRPSRYSSGASIPFPDSIQTLQDKARKQTDEIPASTSRVQDGNADQTSPGRTQAGNDREGKRRKPEDR